MGQCLSVASQVAQEVAAAAAEENNQQQGAAAAPAPAYSSSSSSLSPVYSSLPSNAEQHKVRNVYDGDTLTLVDERRVRFLGIDTPEIKEQQAFAQEAKAYTKDLCDKRDIWISFEPNSDKEDHYGRLLAFVWVPSPNNENGYLCVNEGIVAAGLASAYIPNQKSKLHNWDKLVALQKQARNQKLNLWSNFDDFTVYKTANGSAYHRRDCEHLENVHNLTELKRSEAMDMGLHACRTCKPDE